MLLGKEGGSKKPPHPIQIYDYTQKKTIWTKLPNNSDFSNCNIIIVYTKETLFKIDS